MRVSWTRIRAAWPRRRVIGTGVTVLALALIMTVGWALNEPASEPTSPIQDARLLSAVKPGAAETSAAAGVDQNATPGSTPSSGSGAVSAATAGSDGDSSDSPTGPSPTAQHPAGDDWLASVDSLTSLLPAVLPGYALGSTVQQAPDASRQYTPTTGSGVRRVTISVHDGGTALAAASYVLKVTKRAYPASPKSFSVPTGTGYAGMDSGGLAAAAFARGRFAFEVVIAPEPGRGADVRTEAIRIATGLEAAR